MLMKQDKTKQYLYKKSYLNRRLQRDVMENGIAYIPCKVESIDDIISRFSVKGCESLDSEFLDYVTDFIDFIPADYPVVLEITGPQFSPEEKKIISETVTGDMDYLLGRTEENHLVKRRRFWFMIAGTLISGGILSIAKKTLPSVPAEFFYVLFWLFADALVRYLFIEKMDYKDERIRIGRLASMNVEFIEEKIPPENLIP